MFVVVLLFLLAALAVMFKKLTIMAGIFGCAIGSSIWIINGYTGLLLMATFFLLGTLSTMWGIDIKYKNGFAENETSRRDAGQVFANAGIPLLLCFINFIYPTQSNVINLMIAGSFSAATADTLSSELGNRYGKNFYNIITFRRDTKGMNGVVSMEGTGFGVLGSGVIASVYALSNSWDIHFFIILLAGTFGNIVDSILGATLERKNYLTNNQVNFLNTAAGAIVSLLLYIFSSNSMN